MSRYKGIVFNIQKFSVHDGPSIRDVVFLKGCPMRCIWCSNPESQNVESELAYNPNKCIGWEACGSCIERCSQEAVNARKDGKSQWIGRSAGYAMFVLVAVVPRPLPYLERR